jgi:hypothetical protein
MISSNDGWAVGSESDFLHWNGTTWETVSNDPYTRSITSVYMLSSTDGWAVGDAMRSGYGRSSIAHWDGQTWLDSASPTGVGLSSVAMLSPDDGWAVGAGAILHYGQAASELFLPLILKGHGHCGQDSLTNGDFESDDAGWELYTSGTGPKAHDLIGSFDEGYSPYAGDYAARLGGFEGVWDTLEQTVVIPAQGTLSYWWKMGTYETLPHHDWFSVELLQSDGTRVAWLADHNDQDLEGIWQHDRIDVSAFAGQELVLRFAGYNDNYYYSWFDLDEVSLCGP